MYRSKVIAGALALAASCLVLLPSSFAHADEGHTTGYYLDVYADGYLDKPTDGLNVNAPALLQVKSASNHQVKYVCSMPSGWPSPTYSIKYNLEIFEDTSTSIAQTTSPAWPNLSQWAAYTGAVLTVSAGFDLNRGYSVGSHSDEAWAEAYNYNGTAGSDTHTFTVH